MNLRRRAFLGAIAVAATLCLGASVGCDKPKPQDQAPREDKLVVFAAASLREVFTTIGEDFERAHPGVEITFNFAGTQELRTQLEHGASADVFASADQRHMDELVRASRAESPAVFARNEPVVVVSKESMSTITGFAKLPEATRIVIGTPEVPIGRYTLQILDNASKKLGSDFRARVEANVVSRELNVRQVLSKISLGEAQAGFVYRTDAQTVKEGIGLLAIPAELNVVAEYPIAVVTGAEHPSLARSFVDYVRSAEGQHTLSAAGFSAPADLAKAE
ncbi:MAG: molybdate ABC transporter substrate-binding protein [Polyangiaceae bacterium]|nr:molybdate ABC transporter substrate-binding protein [Polyangiaceae bacterium]